MALTVEGAQLTAAHRSQQLALRAGTLLDLAQLWHGFDVAKPGSYDAFATAAALLVRDRHGDSAALANAYLRAFREAEGVGGAAPVPARPARPDLGAVGVSLRATGLAGTVRALRAGQSVPRALASGLVQVSGAVGRLVLGGGQDAVADYAGRDPKARGWFRVTSGSPCAFCAMLASRGPVYREERSVAFQAHDHCACGGEPNYGGDWPGRAREFEELWQAEAAGLSGGDAVRAFRRAYRRAYERRGGAEPDGRRPGDSQGGTARLAPEAVPGPQAGRRAVPVSREPEPDLVAEAQQLADAWHAGHRDGMRLASGQGGAGVRRVTLSDGAEAVYRSAQGSDEARNEYLAGLVARALGIPGVRTALVGEAETVSALVPGATGAARIKEGAATLGDLVRLRNGREIGLMDWLTAQADRNSANFLADGDTLYPIDHEFANFQWLTDDATAEMMSPFSWAHLTDSADITRRDDAERLVSPFSAAELAEIRQRLEALHPEFDRLDAARHHEFMMARLADVEAVAA